MRPNHARLLIALVLVAIIAFPTPASAASVCLELGLLAVNEDNGALHGEVIPAQLTVTWPGNGTVSLLSSNDIGPSTRVSTFIAFQVAAILAGIDPRYYNVTITFKTEEPVSGPSASGFIAAALYSIFIGLEPSKKATMTGMTSATGFVLPVAGLSYKLEAAAREGYVVTIVPWQPDILENSSLPPQGLTIRHACSIEDAALLLAGGNPVNLTTRLALNPLTLFGNEVAKFRYYALLFSNYTLKLVDSIDNEHVAKIVERLARESITIADKSPYSAASMAFLSLYLASTAVAEQHGYAAVERLLGVSIEDILAEARTSVEHAASLFNYTGSCGLWGFEALAAAKLRLYLAEHAAKSDDEDVKVLALLRAYSAESWAKLARVDYGPRVSCAELREAVRILVNYANYTYEYLASIIDRYINVTRMVDGRTIEEWLADARHALENGDYALAAGIALYVVDEVEQILITSSPLPQSCVLGRAERIEILQYGRGLLGLVSGLTLAYALGEANLTANITGNHNIPEGLAITSIVWSLLPLTLTSIEPSGAPAPTLAPASCPLRSIQQYIMALVIVSAVLAILAYASALTARRARLEVVQ
ncbi:S16 family serine protease [Hyperthermus butylicus]|uniref:Archaeal serine protease n=1 Tax=Hyperthermus butylicus (strain DSM 5456 / JCM 9403 / PLM1-5) TaxID=415426 RepID=A2BJ04_HYPBU|nr:S16 family serine protease [Hyperthermus butylicus]ABM79965.1 Archaeal serine protease [Hyperthermus butylicus DSM 5456]